MMETPKVKAKTLPWDAAEYLETENDMAVYLDAAFEEGDAPLVATALGDIVRAKGMIATRSNARSATTRRADRLDTVCWR